MTIAAHIVGFLAYAGREHDALVTSDDLASSIGTSPVVVRRVLGLLRAAGLVTSKRGPAGGSALAVPARSFTLKDVFNAVNVSERRLLPTHPGEVGEHCTVAPVIAEYLEEVYNDAEAALLAQLDQVDVESFSQEIVRRTLARRASRLS